MGDSKQKKPMTASDYVKNQPHLQGKPLFNNQNSFSALAEFPPLSYSKAVATDKGQTSNPTQNPTPNPIRRTTYFTKPQKQHLLTTQFTQQPNLNQLHSFTNRIFHENSLYPTDHLLKDRTFYEFILVDSKSVQITHYPDKNNQNLISYSTCKILRVCTIQDLGFLHQHSIKPFCTPGYHIDGYTYNDYQNAFLRVLYLRPYDHSWFISFDHKCPHTIPGWFYEWWHWFGPADQIYPESILKTSYPYYKKYSTQQKADIIPKITFHIDMGIPWIFSWNFSLAPIFPDIPYSLIREFRVKWWDKYTIDRCSLTNIQKFFEINQQLAAVVRQVSKSIPLLTPSQPTKQLSTPSSSQASKPTSTPKRQASPAHSTDSSHSKKTSKKDKLKQIIAAISHEMVSSDSDDEVMQDSDPYGGPLSQDPFEL